MNLCFVNTQLTHFQLARTSDTLDERSGILNDVLKDVAFGKDPRGARGMSAETILRAALLKQTQNLTYEELAFQPCDSEAARGFARLADGESYSAFALQANITAISSNTWQMLQFEAVSFARESKFERGRTVRMDATVVETNIAYPIDSHLLVEALRVVSRNVFWLKEQGIKLPMPFSHKASRKLMLRILNAAGAEERRAAYQPLIIGCGDVWRCMDCVIEQVAQLPDNRAAGKGASRSSSTSRFTLSRFWHRQLRASLMAKPWMRPTKSCLCSSRIQTLL